MTNYKLQIGYQGGFKYEIKAERLSLLLKVVHGLKHGYNYIITNCTTGQVESVGRMEDGEIIIII